MSSTNERPHRRSWVFGCAIGSIAIILSSCPLPIDVAILNRVKDDTGPTIVITSPADGSTCANIVQVDGTVTDSATAAGDDGGITSLAYEVLGTTTAAEVTPEADGSFTFQFTTNSFGDTFTLAITATDWNGNPTTESLILHREAGSGLPSFTAVAGNHSVNLEWDPVPNTASYSLRYTTNGALPSDTVGTEVTDVTSPMELTGLENGNLHVFQLFAVPVDVPDDPWPESISDFVQAVPLSEQTLSPRVTGEVGGIRVEWLPIAADDTYEVWRSTEIDGTYVDLSGPIRATEYFDTDVAGTGWYYYKIRPADFANDVSAAGAAQLSALTMHEPTLVSSVAFQEMDPDAERGYRVKVDGNYAYVADMAGGLQIVDISDPENAVTVGQCATADRAFDVAVAGNYAFVADANAGLTVVDVSNKSSPTVVTSAVTPDAAVSIAISGSYAYVADITSLQIFDISAPTAPAAPTTVSVSADAVAVDGGYVYVACPGDDPNDFKVYSESGILTDPPPVGLTTSGSTIEGFTWTVVVQGNYAYVPDREYGLKIIDVSNPASPSLVATCQTPGWIYDVVVDGPYAFAACESGGLQIINVSDPVRVSDNSIIGFRTTHTVGGGLGIARRGQYVCMAEWQYGLSVLKVAAPTAPAVVGTLTGLDQPAGAYPLGVAVRQSYAYIADYKTGLRIADISVPTSPQLVSTLDLVDGVDDTTSGIHRAYEISLSGNRAYVAEKVKVVDITDPDAPALLGSVYTNGFSRSITTFGPYAYTSNTNIGLHLVDISVDDAPFIAVLRDTTGEVFDTEVRGSYAYLADSSDGMHVFDTSDPAQITDLGTFPLASENNAFSIAAEGSLAALLGGDYNPYDPDWEAGVGSVSRLHLVNITSPTTPSEYDTDSTAGGTQPMDLSSPSAAAQTVELHQRFAFVVDTDATDGRLDVIDVSQPTVPFLAGTVSVPNATDVAVSGRYAYVTTSAGDLKIVDLLPDL